MKMFPARSILTLSAAVLLSGTAGAATIFEETFDNTGERGAHFNEGVSISEFPGSVKKLYAKTEKPSAFFKKPLSIRNCPANFRLTFQAAFYAPERYGFNVELYFNNDVKNRKNITVDFNHGSRIHQSAANVNTVPLGSFFGAGQLERMQPSDGLFQMVELRKINGRLSLFVERNGKMVLESSAFLPDDHILTGLNFSGKTVMHLDDIRVETISAEEAAKTVSAAGETFDLTEKTLTVRPAVYPVSFLLRFTDRTGKTADYTFSTAPQLVRNYRKVALVDEVKDGKKIKVKKTVAAPFRIEDAILQVSGPDKLQEKIYSYPRLYWRYTQEQLHRIIADLHGHGAPFSGMDLNFSLRGRELYLNNDFLCYVATDGIPEKVTLFAAGPVQFSVREGTPFTELDDDLIALPVPAWCKDGFFPTALCKETQGSFALECDGYLARTAFEGHRDSYLRRVPNTQYHKATAVCSFDGDPEKSKDVTLRVTRFIQDDGRVVTGMALDTVNLDDETKVRKLGQNLYEVQFTIPIGNIQDVVFMENKNYLDVEVLGGLYEKNNFYMSREGKPAIRKSGVRVHSLILQKTPATLFVRNGSIGNVFYAGENAFVTSEVTAVKPGTCSLRWEVKDMEGGTVDSGTEEITFKTAGEKREIRHNFRVKTTGLYSYSITLSETGKGFFGNGGEDLVTYAGTFSRLPADTRKAKLDSPYFAWNYNGAAGTCRDPAIWSVLLKHMGVRKTVMSKYSEKDMAKYGTFTSGQYPNLHRIVLKNRDKTVAERAELLDKEIKKHLALYPGVKEANIFHESGGGVLPLELLGGKTVVTPEEAAIDKQKTQDAIEIAKAWRKAAPHVKLVVGNTGESFTLLGQLFRNQYPRELIDFTGDESGAMTIPPEQSVARVFWAQQKLAEIYGYKNVKPTACYEWKTRPLRYFTSMRLFAAFIIRDSLIAHAWNSNLIPLTTIMEPKSSYYNTVWGYAAFSRDPLLQPNEGFQAIATMTQLLDQVKFIRMIPTGSQSIYALEFRRPDRTFVYALWSARGTADAAFRPAAAKPVKIDLYGRRSAVKPEAFSIGEEPVYLESRTAIDAFTVAQTRTYPLEQDCSKAVAATPMDKAEDWTLVEGSDPRLDDIAAHVAMFHLSAMRPGKFALTQVQDAEKGNCLEVKLVPEGACAELMREYGFIRMKQPAEISGTPDTVGVWVKGNSGWGKIFLELEDAEGEIWLSAGTGGYGCMVYDWPDMMGINFDGWHFLQFPLTAKSPVKIFSPGEHHFQWQNDRSGDGKVTYPVKVRGIGFALSRKTLNLLKMEDVKDLSIRFKDFSAY